MVFLCVLMIDRDSKIHFHRHLEDAIFADIAGIYTRKELDMSTVKLEDIQAGTQTTSDSALQIEMPDGKLPIGQHKFALKVVDNSGNQSQFATLSVLVIDTQAPMAILELRDASGQPVPDNRIPYGTSFILDGKKSTDVGGGNIVKYIWELIS